MGISIKQLMYSKSAKLAISLLGIALIALTGTLTTRAWRVVNINRVGSVNDSNGKRPASKQSATLLDIKLHGLLSQQPEASRLSLKLGRRYLQSGREIAIQAGLIAVGGNQQAIRLTRRQVDTGEELAIALDNGPATLTWGAKDGAKDGGQPISGEKRAQVERIALDSADQFILAQARGAIYETIARQVRPANIGNGIYSGPTWDVVRVLEAVDSFANKPLSNWRLYYVNTVTGLIDKIVSQEEGRILTAELSDWVEQTGEKFPRKVTWNRDGQTVMQLTLNATTFSNAR